jgi:DNA-binding transcriptional ArsR family regulator
MKHRQLRRLTCPRTSLGVPVRIHNLTAALLVARELTRGWRRALDISEATGVHRRVVYRHLSAFRHVGLTPLRESRGRFVYWHLSPRELAAWMRGHR